jgi:hypothetical protein
MDLLFGRRFKSGCKSSLKIYNPATLWKLVIQRILLGSTALPYTWLTIEVLLVLAINVLLALNGECEIFIS